MHRESLKASKDGKSDEVVIFNENKFDFFCEVCDTHVLANSKHCQRCNRCTYEFDHHCLWVSNDIGLSNYHGFMRMLIAVLFTVLLQIAMVTVAIFTAFDARESFLLTDEIGFMPSSAFIILNYVTAGLMALLLAADIYLISYHTMLICKNTTTYRYIR